MASVQKNESKCKLFLWVSLKNLHCEYGDFCTNAFPSFSLIFLCCILEGGLNKWAAQNSELEGVLNNNYLTINSTSLQALDLNTLVFKAQESCG